MTALSERIGLYSSLILSLPASGQILTQICARDDQPLLGALRVVAPAPEIVFVLDRKDTVVADVEQGADVRAPLYLAETGQGIAPPAWLTNRLASELRTGQDPQLIQPLGDDLGVFGVRV